MPTLYTMVAPCFFGTESTLNFEVKRLRCPEHPGHRRPRGVAGRGRHHRRRQPEPTHRRACAAAAGYLQGHHLDELFDGCYNIAWEELLPADAAFPVKGSSLSSQPLPACPPARAS